MTIVIIGKKVPEGFEEEAGSIHLGDGVWIFKCKIKDAKSTKNELSEEDKEKADNYVKQTCHEIIRDVIMKDYTKDKLNVTEQGDVK